MNIEDKLQLQVELGGVLLFREGLFLKAYNESCFILNELLNQNLKVKSYRLKCLKGRAIVECAFQHAKLAKRLPKAVETDFGARLCGEFDLQQYQTWHAKQCQISHEVAEMAQSAGQPRRAVDLAAAPRSDLYAGDVSSVFLQLTHQQWSYLQNWQRDLYPLEVEQGFIESLKRQFAF